MKTKQQLIKIYNKANSEKFQEKTELKQITKNEAMEQIASLPLLQGLTIKEVENIFTPDGNEAWGKYKDEWIGRSMVLYCDDEVMWAGKAEGGLRVSHVSHIDKPISKMLAVSRGRKKLFTLLPLAVDPPCRFLGGQSLYQCLRC